MTLDWKTGVRPGHILQISPECEVNAAFRACLLVVTEEPAGQCGVGGGGWRMNRRGLLRMLGLGGAAAAGEAVPGIGNVWFYNNVPMPPMSSVPHGAGYGPDPARLAAQPHLGQHIAHFGAQQVYPPPSEQGHHDYYYTMTDWGGAL